MRLKGLTMPLNTFLWYEYKYWNEEQVMCYTFLQQAYINHIFFSHLNNPVSPDYSEQYCYNRNDQQSVYDATGIESYISNSPKYEQYNGYYVK